MISTSFISFLFCHHIFLLYCIPFTQLPSTASVGIFSHSSRNHNLNNLQFISIQVILQVVIVILVLFRQFYIVGILKFPTRGKLAAIFQPSMSFQYFDSFIRFTTPHPHTVSYFHPTSNLLLTPIS